MALTVETGAIVTGADSYVPLADYQTYGANRGWTLEASDAEDDVNLRRAYDALNRNWQYIGEQVNAQTQTGAFPRYIIRDRFEYVVPADTIPQAIKDAQMELAYLIQGGLDPFATITGSVGRKKVKAGPVETETEYLGGLAKPRLVAVEGLLGPFLAAGQGQQRLSRA